MRLIKENMTNTFAFPNVWKQTNKNNKEQNWLSEKKSNDKAMQLYTTKKNSSWVLHHSITANHSHHSMASKWALLQQ